MPLQRSPSVNGIDPAASDEHRYDRTQLLDASELSQVRIALSAQGRIKNDSCSQKC